MIKWIKDLWWLWVTLFIFIILNIFIFIIGFKLLSYFQWYYEFKPRIVQLLNSKGIK